MMRELLDRPLWLFDDESREPRLFGPGRPSLREPPEKPGLYRLIPRRQRSASPDPSNGLEPNTVILCQPPSSMGYFPYSPEPQSLEARVRHLVTEMPYDFPCGEDLDFDVRDQRQLHSRRLPRRGAACGCSSSSTDSRPREGVWSSRSNSPCFPSARVTRVAMAWIRRWSSASLRCVRRH